MLNEPQRRTFLAVLVAGGSLLLALPVLAQGGVPAAHGDLTEYTGSETCLDCHPDSNKQVAASLHYTLLGEAPLTEGSGSGELAGMMVSYSTPWASVADINWTGITQPVGAAVLVKPSGCVTCHIGFGPKPNPPGALTDADDANVDCLICHGPDYSRQLVDQGDTFVLAPAEGVDVLAVAQNAQRPTNEMCLRCHTGAGGSPDPGHGIAPESDRNAKHGDIPTPGTDVHMAAGLQCVDCHTSEDHRIAGGADLKARELPEVDVTCANCHTTEPHGEYGVVEGTGVDAGALLNGHVEHIACQTCHIPFAARDLTMATITYRDYANGNFNPDTLLYGQAQFGENDVLPEYHWWNGRMQDPPQPVGERGDGRITPWKQTTYNVPVDSATGEPVTLDLGTFMVAASLDAAVTQGVAARGVIQPGNVYSGSYEMREETLVFSINHQVAPADEALICTQCHTEEGRLDFVALGYLPEETANLTAFPPPITDEALFAETEDDAEVAPTDEPVAQEEEPAPSGGVCPLAAVVLPVGAACVAWVGRRRDQGMSYRSVFK